MHIGEDNEVFMTPEDFVRSLTPGKVQPPGKIQNKRKTYRAYDLMLLVSMHETSLNYFLISFLLETKKNLTQHTCALVPVKVLQEQLHSTQHLPTGLRTGK